MGVDYRAVVGVGKEFNDKWEAQSFLEQHEILTKDDLEEIEEDGLEEWSYKDNKIEVVCLDAYSGDYYFVGYELSCSDPESFRKSFEDATEQWDKLFPNLAPDVVKTVKVY